MKRIVSGILFTLFLLNMLTSSLTPSYLNSYINVTVSEVKQMIESNPNLAILDVRTQAEYDSGHIQNATLIPLDQLASRLGELDKNEEILVYCAAGGRSATASQTLVDNGFSEVYNMLGGITAWKSAGYWIEIIHDGDLIIDGTQTFVIENCTYIEAGKVYVRNWGKLKVKNSELWINQTSPYEYAFNIEDYGILALEDANLTSLQPLYFDFWEYSQADFENVTLSLGSGSFLMFHDFSKASIDQLIFLDMHGLFFMDNSAAYITRSRINQVQVYVGDCSLRISSSSVSRFCLNFKSGLTVQLDNLKPGSYEFLNLQQSVTIQGASCDIMLNNTLVEGWVATAFYDSQTSISNSLIECLGIHVQGASVYLDNLRPQFYEYEQIGQVILRNSSITGWINVFTVQGSSVTIKDSTVDVMAGYDSDISIIDSVVGLEIDRNFNFSGLLSFERAICTGVSVFYGDFYLYGNVSFEGGIIRWYSSKITRNYSVIAREINGNVLENAALTLFDKNDALVWNGTTDSLGQADFNLTFADNNYADTLRLEAVKGNLSVAENITFLSDTPVILQFASSITGDINGDGAVDIYDAIMLANAYNSRPEDSNWNANADISNDGTVDIYDAIILASNYGKKA